jgi:DNA-binding transcriptional MerR regulator
MTRADRSSCAAAERHYRVGQVAALTGISIRTLHHYDTTGVLRPSRRLESGRRLYSSADLLKLQQHAGRALGELDQHVVRGRQVVRLISAHRRRVDGQIASATRQDGRDDVLGTAQAGARQHASPGRAWRTRSH